MSAPPKTVLTATPEEAAAIRHAVRNVADRPIAGPEHVDGLLALFSDPRVSDPIYDLPRPFTRESVAKWVADSEALRQEGRCILSVSLDDAGQVAGYSRFTVWPERSAAEIAGGRRADLQNSGSGRQGVAQSVAFMFEVLGVRLIALTAALDNIRSAKAIEGAGFKRMGEVESVRPDGTTRRSLYWELSRDEWLRRHVL
ncbi:GNAT family N-acetyltransferase [Phenylobacterium sp. LH3H17]|uniref:GNAT family N-acetyltransferase n=1 Tax=Phenylobacterium sp. LH3H17 TaxID=2903901 RepID=UPI0020C9A136|nr:GNAT family protein [Phenylobacterium sp. LH3H17]UTP38996.1 GNAT family N-acetyltransferase [Phenylobacterium sp. LH3H17]